MAKVFTISDSGFDFGGGLGGLGFRGRAARCKYGRKVNGRCRKKARKGRAGGCKYGVKANGRCRKRPRGRRR